MATIIQSNRVLYLCSCEEENSLYNLFFCRHCSAIRCRLCVSEEIDTMFCPHCLETNSAGEARLKKDRCVNCNLCPICETVLSTHSPDGTSVFLVCNVCRWSTHDSDVPENSSKVNWPVYESNLTEELNKVTEKMRGLAAAEKAARDQAKTTKRRTGPSGNLMSDRFGFQIMYQRRVKAMENALPSVPTHDAISEITSLDFDNINEESLLSLDCFIRQPTSENKPIRPVRMPLKARKAIRCKQCDHNIIKLDFGPCAIKYKVHYFARYNVPEIRLSRDPTIVMGENGFSILLTVSNESDAKAEIIILPDPDSSNIEWITPMVQLLLPPQDEDSDFMESHKAMESGESVVFRRRHRAGIRIEAKTTNQSNNKWLGLLLKFKNELCSTKQEKQNDWHLTRVRIQLQV